MTKLLYRIGGATQWVTLFDSSLQPQVVMPDMKGSTKWTVPSYPGFGANSECVSPEGNAMTSLPWRFGQSYATNQAATASIRLMQTKFNGVKFHLQYVQDGEVQYYPNGAVESYSWEQNGCYVWHQFTFKTELVTTTAPTT
jgi:hypothetical protein